MFVLQTPFVLNFNKIRSTAFRFFFFENEDFTKRKNEQQDNRMEAGAGMCVGC